MQLWSSLEGVIVFKVIHIETSSQRASSAQRDELQELEASCIASHTWKNILFYLALVHGMNWYSFSCQGHRWGGRRYCSFVFVQPLHTKRWSVSFSVLLVVGLSLCPFAATFSSPYSADVAGMGDGRICRLSPIFPLNSNSRKDLFAISSNEGLRQQCASQVNHSMKGCTWTSAIKLSLDEEEEPLWEVCPSEAQRGQWNISSG